MGPKDRDGVLGTAGPSETGPVAPRCHVGIYGGVAKKGTPRIHREQVGSETASGPGGAVVRVQQTEVPAS